MVILNYETKNDFAASAVPKAYNIKSFVYDHFICVCCRVGFGDYLIFFQKIRSMCFVCNSFSYDQTMRYSYKTCYIGVYFIDFDFRM